MTIEQGRHQPQGIVAGDRCGSLLMDRGR